MHYIILFVAEYAIIVAGLIAILYWLTLNKTDKVRFAVFGLIAGLVGLVLMKVGAVMFYDPRPFVSHNLVPLFPHAADNGFPSDHTALAAVIAVTVFAFSRRLGFALFVLALAIGLARVFGHVHSPIDIVGSIVFAFLSGAVAYYLTPKLMKRLKV